MQNNLSPNAEEIYLNHVKHAMDWKNWSLKVISTLTESGLKGCSAVKKGRFYFLHKDNQVLKNNDDIMLFKENGIRLIHMKMLKLTKKNY